MPNAIKIQTGAVFGQLTVLGPGTKDRWNAILWRVKCSCGTVKEIRSSALLKGLAVSCGCKKIKHGERRRSGTSSEYRVWSGMINRCTNVRSEDYPMYGGRGIAVCDRWRNDFAEFLKDMGRRPVGCTLDRRDNDKGYEPGNCRWRTATEQARNTSANVLIDCRGQKKSLAEWAEQSPVKYSTIYKRLQLGWNPERAIFSTGGAR